MQETITLVDRSIRAVARAAVISLAVSAWLGASLISTAEVVRTHFRAVDFIAFYTAGYMVHSGQSANLYNNEAVIALENQIAGAHRVARPYIHPPFEAVFFSPLSILPYRAAYLIFLLFNLGCVWVSYKLLRPQLEFLSRWGGWLPVVIFVGFIPLVVALAQGQDSLLLLLILAAVQRSLHREQDGWAGVLLGLATFRPQIVVPIVLLFVLWRRWRLAAGFAIAASAVAILGLLAGGLRGTLLFFGKLKEFGLEPSASVNENAYGVPVRYMGNLRGLFTMVLQGQMKGRTILLVIALASVLVLGLAWMSAKSLSTAVLASALVSYHFLVHDMSVLLVPVVAILGNPHSSRAQMGAVIVLLGTQVITAYAPSHFWMAIPILAVFLLGCWPVQRMLEIQPASSLGSA